MSYGCHNKNVCDKYKNAMFPFENPCSKCLKSLEKWNDETEDEYQDEEKYTRYRRW